MRKIIGVAFLLSLAALPALSADVARDPSIVVEGQQRPLDSHFRPNSRALVVSVTLGGVFTDLGPLYETALNAEQLTTDLVYDPQSSVWPDLSNYDLVLVSYGDVWWNTGFTLADEAILFSYPGNLVLVGQDYLYSMEGATPAFVSRFDIGGWTEDLNFNDGSVMNLTGLGPFQGLVDSGPPCFTANQWLTDHFVPGAHAGTAPIANWATTDPGAGCPCNGQGGSSVADGIYSGVEFACMANLQQWVHGMVAHFGLTPPPNQLPVCDAGGPYSANQGETIQFDGTGSTDPDGTIVSYAWDFGDGQQGSGPTPTHAYTECDRSYTVALTVTDDDGATRQCEANVDILTRVEVIRAQGPMQNVGQHVGFRASVFGGTPQSYQWALEGGFIRNYTAYPGYPFAYFTHTPAELQRYFVSGYWLPLSSQVHPGNAGPLPRQVAVTVTMQGGLPCEGETTVQVERNATDLSLQPSDLYAIPQVHASWHATNPLAGTYGRKFFGFHRAALDVFRSWRTLFGYDPVVGIWDSATGYPDDPEINIARWPYNAPKRVPLPSWLTVGGTVPRVRPPSHPPCDTQGGQLTLCDFPSNTDLLGCVAAAYWHDLVHQRVGPAMASPYSASWDGLFWRFHEFVDLLRQYRRDPAICPPLVPPAPLVLYEAPYRVFPTIIQAPDSILVTFHEPVTGVTASDLVVAGSPAMSVTGSAAGPYTFRGFATPPYGSIPVAFGPGGIQSPGGTPFEGDAWEYTFIDPALDPDADGLANIVEVDTLFTDPMNADTDDDGDGDGDEVISGTNPLVDERWLDATTVALAGPDSTVGVAWGDYDGDGDADLFVSNNGDPSRLYSNDGGGEFTDVTMGPLADPGTNRGAAWGDFDDDGDLDLFVARGNEETDRLYRNEGGGAFVDVTAGPLADTGDGHAVAWADYDRDGWLDLFVVNDGSSSRLLRNLGDGTFADATPVALSAPGPGRGAAWGDFDADGDPDLCLARAGLSCQLFRNDGAGSFSDVTSGPIGDPGEWMGVAWGDADNDGDLDLALASGAETGGGNRILRNDGGVFADATPVTFSDAGASASVSWFDADNDTDLDLYVTARGYPGNRFYRNDGGGAFADVSREPLDLFDLGWGAATGDYDGDGELDLHVGTEATNHLLRNDYSAGNHWLQVRLVGTVSNRSAIGARVRAVSGGASQIREISGGSGYCAQDEPIAAFGLGASTTVDTLVVWWPSGLVSDTLAVTSDQVITLVEASGPIAVGSPSAALPARYALQRALPNPFRADVAITYDAPRAGLVTLQVYDAAGRLVRTLLDSERVEPGRHRALWDGRGASGQRAPSGVYFCQFHAGEFRATRRLVMIR